jgi:hypothetical protein
VERGLKKIINEINIPKKYPHLNCGFVLVKRKVAFLSEGAWSSEEYLKSALPLYTPP